MQLSTSDSCNIYFVEEGICTAGFLDFPKTFSKPFGSSATLVPVNIVTATASRNLGRKVKPGKVFFIFFSVPLLQNHNAFSGLCWNEKYFALTILKVSQLFLVATKSSSLATGSSPFPALWDGKTGYSLNLWTLQISPYEYFQVICQRIGVLSYIRRIPLTF